MKKLLSIFLIASMFCATPVMANNNITVKINNEIVKFDVQPQIINGYVYVPMRTIFEKLGATIKWDNNSNTITSSKDNTTIKLVIGEDKINVNGNYFTLPASAKIIDGKTLVPIRTISESFSYDVNWNEDTNEILINTNKI